MVLSKTRFKGSLLFTKLVLLGLISAYVSPATAQAEDIQFSVSGQTLTAKGYGFISSRQRSYQVNLYVNSDYKTNVNTDDSGSFSLSTTVRAGDFVTVKVLDYRGAGNHYTRDYTVQDSGYSNQEIYNYANQQARTVANRVVDTYALYENWKYNFSEGFWQSFIIAQSGGLSNLSAYGRGASEGESQGRNQGLAAGQSYGRDHGGSKARSDVRSRFAAVVDQNRAPDESLQVPDLMIQGLNANFPQVTPESILDKFDAQLQSEMALLSWSTNGYVLRYSDLDRWSLRNVYAYGGQGRYQFIDSWFRGDWAYTEWQNNRLGGGYDYNIYHKLSYSERSRFESDFKTIYNQVIDSKLNRERTKSNAAALIRGVWYGQQAAQDLAYETGRRSTYMAAYQSASITGFDQTFKDSYRSAFQESLNFYNTNYVLDFQVDSWIDENRNGVLEPGEKVGIRIGRVINLGRVAAQNLSVSLSGEKVSPLSSEAQSFSLAASTSTKQSVEFSELAVVSTDLQADHPYQMTFKMGPLSTSLTHVLSKASIVELFVNSDASASSYQAKRAYLMSKVKEEFLQAISTRTNVYKKGQNSYLHQLVAFYLKGTEEQKRNIREVSSDILPLAKTGGGWHPFIRHSFKKLMQQIN